MLVKKVVVLAVVLMVAVVVCLGACAENISPPSACTFRTKSSSLYVYRYVRQQQQCIQVQAGPAKKPIIRQSGISFERQ